jgi:hypothetical protein
MNVADTDRVSAIARVSGAKKKRPKVLEGQESLLDENGAAAEDVDAEAEGAEDYDAAAEELVAEEFEDAEEGAVAETNDGADD